MLKDTLVSYQPSPGAAMGTNSHAPLPRHASLRHKTSMADLMDHVVQMLLKSSSVGKVGGALVGTRLQYVH